MGLFIVKTNYIKNTKFIEKYTQYTSCACIVNQLLLADYNIIYKYCQSKHINWYITNLGLPKKQDCKSFYLLIICIGIEFMFDRSGCWNFCSLDDGFTKIIIWRFPCLYPNRWNMDNCNCSHIIKSTQYHQTNHLTILTINKPNIYVLMIINYSIS